MTNDPENKPDPAEKDEPKDLPPQADPKGGRIGQKPLNPQPLPP